ncbi:MAG TPA: CHASE3 domain-containing protein, partial [Rudaea sp.]
MENRASPPAGFESSKRTLNRWLPPGPTIGFIVALITVVVSAIASYQTLRQSNLAGANASHALEVQRAVRMMLSNLTDAETGQRGFLLTNDAKYLEPYERAKSEMPGNLAALHRLSSQSVEAQSHIDRIGQLTAAKLSELGETIERVRAGDAAGAIGVVKTDRGKNVMDDIRTETAAILMAEDLSFQQSQQIWHRASNLALVVTAGSSAVLFFLIAYAAAMISRDYRTREAQMWVRNGQALLGLRLQGDQRMEALGESALQFLCDYLDAQVGAFYVAQSDGSYHRIAGYAIPP